MKPILIVLLSLLLPALTRAESPESVVTSIRERDANLQRIEVVSTRLDAMGAMVSETNGYVQIESGLHYLGDDRKWETSRAEFVGEGGWAVAKRGQHKVALYHNINVEGGVVLVTRDGKRLRSHVYGLAYYDTSTGKSVLIASVKDSQAQQTGDGEIVYLDAFAELSADVRYTYTKAGFEQDIILREQPPTPEAFGFDPASTRLEVWTQFVEGESPSRAPRVLNPKSVASGAAEALVDEDLQFGTLHIGQGRTFALGREEEALSMVAKNWIETEDGYKFLVETVAVESVAAGLELLPAGPGPDGAKLHRPHSGRLHAGYRPNARPAIREGVQVSIPRLDRARDVAQLDALRRPGLVLDYVAVAASLGACTFQSDETYYVSGDTEVTGAAVIEGGAVFKFNTSTSSIKFKGAVDFSSTEY